MGRFYDLAPHSGCLAFSLPKFVPGTYDEVIVALKSEEIAETDYQTTFITVFTLNGDVLLDEYEVGINMSIVMVPTRASATVARQAKRF